MAARDERRVLMIAERYPPDIGGLARSGARIARAVARLGLSVHVLAWTRQIPAGTVDTFASAGEGGNGEVVLHRVGLYGAWDLSFQHTMNVLEWLHEEHRFDVIWGHYLYPAGFAAVLYGELAEVPTVVSARGNDVDRLMFPPGDFARLRWTLERAHVTTAVSHDLARKINVLMGLDARVEVIGNAVDGNMFRPAPPSAALRERLGILPGEAVLGFSGELRHKKGIEFLLQALVEVRRVRPACLLVIGETRIEEEMRLMTFAAESPEDATRILVTGNLEEPAAVAEHLCLCDVYLQPSLWEGLPNALLEAMACGRVVVGSDAGGIPEVIEHGVNGFIVRKRSLHRLGEVVLELLDLPEEKRAEIGRAARRRIEEAFHPDAEAVALTRVFERAIPRPVV